MIDSLVEMPGWLRFPTVALAILLTARLITYGIRVKDRPEDGVSEKPKSRSQAWIGWTFLATLPLLYVLSAGPANWLAHRGYVANDKARQFYRPVVWLCQKSQVFDRQIFEPYVRLWR